MTEPMSYSDAANILEAHNKWRRGDENDDDAAAAWNPDDTKKLGAAIDVAVDGLRKLQEENENLRVLLYSFNGVYITTVSKP